MEIGVCVKRVPQVGGRIVVTPDGQDVDTRMSGFTVSPHEECAVEEAVQIIERHGGSVTVLTLGPPEAADQLRDMLALGAHRAVLLETAGREWGPIATAAAIAAEARRHAADGPGYDLLLLGNEAADTGDYQVGVRVAHALGWPCVTGIKHLEVTADRARASREYRGSQETFDLAAARGDHRQGGHQPAPVPVAAGAAAGQAGGHRAVPAAVAARGPAQGALRVPQTDAAPGRRARHRRGRGARPGRAAGRARGAVMSVPSERAGMNVLCLVELDEAGVADASLRALTFARHAGRPTGRAAGRRGVRPGRPGARPACWAATA